MTFRLSHSLRSSLGLPLLFAVVLLVVGMAGVARAEDKPQSARTLTDKSSETLGKLDPVLKASNWDTAIVMLKGLVADAPPNSYDKALGSYILAQVLLQHSQATKDKNVTNADYAAVIPLFEYVIASGYYEKAKQLDFLLILAQLYLQVGNAAKAEATVKDWLDNTPKPTAEGFIFYCTLLYQRAQADPKKIDLKVMEQIVQQASRALRTFIKPQENLFLLKAVALQSLDRYAEAAEVLELMVERFPKNGQYWSQLFSLYANLNEPLRAAITIERAQAQGLMTSPRENLTLATLYYNMEQLNKAGELLEKGLHNGTIEGDLTNWELLGFVYQRTYREFKAIDTFTEASKHFKSGKIDSKIAGLYYNLEKMPEALRHLELAIEKGDLDTPFQTMMFAAFVALDQKQHQKALKYVTMAEAQIKSDKEREQFKGLKGAIDEAIRVDEINAAAAAAGQKKSP